LIAEVNIYLHRDIERHAQWDTHSWKCRSYTLAITTPCGTDIATYNARLMLVEKIISAGEALLLE